MGATKKMISHRAPGASSKYGTRRRRVVLKVALAVDYGIECLSHLLLLLAGEGGRNVALGRELGAREDQVVVSNARVLLEQDLLRASNWRDVVHVVLDLRLVLRVVD